MTDDTNDVSGEILPSMARKGYPLMMIVMVVIGCVVIFIGGIFPGRKLFEYQEQTVPLERGSRIVAFHERGYRHFG